MTLRIGTRGSKLATTQAGHMRDRLKHFGRDAELTIVTTPGDVNMSPVERIGVGVFTQALRDALVADEIDVAVHSFKDLPTAPDPRFHLVVPTRADARDALIARDGLTLEELPKGAKVGTSAPRRISQLKALRPDLEILPLRGNIDTRMGKVTSGELDAVVLAFAGLSRVGMQDRATQVFDPDMLMPAPAQGALAIECRVEDEDIITGAHRAQPPGGRLHRTRGRPRHSGWLRRRHHDPDRRCLRPRRLRAAGLLRAGCGRAPRGARGAGRGPAHRTGCSHPAGLGTPVGHPASHRKVGSQSDFGWRIIRWFVQEWLYLI